MKRPRESRRKEVGEQRTLVLKEPFLIRLLLRPPPLLTAAWGPCAPLWLTNCGFHPVVHAHVQRNTLTQALLPRSCPLSGQPCLEGSVYPTPTSDQPQPRPQSPSPLSPLAPSVSIFTHSPSGGGGRVRWEAMTWKAGGLVFQPAVCPWGELLPLWKPRGWVGVEMVGVLLASWRDRLKVKRAAISRAPKPFPKRTESKAGLASVQFTCLESLRG